MSLLCHTAGVVIRVRRDKDVMLTLLTPEMGRISVIAKGARSFKGPQMALSQLFCYGDFELYRRGDLYWLNTGELRENFYRLTKRLDSLNLASYFCEIAYAASEVGVGAQELMRLLLNSLSFLENETHPISLIKGVYEWRVMAMQGMTPRVRACRECHAEQDACFALDIAQGALLCSSCRAKQHAALPITRDAAGNSDLVLLSPGALQAIRYTLATPMEKMLSFRLPEKEDRRLFTLAGEKFLQYHLDYDGTALHMYHTMKDETND